MKSKKSVRKWRLNIRIPAPTVELLSDWFISQLSLSLSRSDFQSYRKRRCLRLRGRRKFWNFLSCGCQTVLQLPMVGLFTEVVQLLYIFKDTSYGFYRRYQYYLSKPYVFQLYTGTLSARAIFGKTYQLFVVKPCPVACRPFV